VLGQRPRANQSPARTKAGTPHRASRPFYFALVPLEIEVPPARNSTHVIA
jgi:hypothetical protein